MRCSRDGCDGESNNRVFCPACGKVLDRTVLVGIEMQGFRGRFSLKDSIERMYATGDPPG